MGLDDRFLRVEMKVREDQPAAILALSRGTIERIDFERNAEEERLIGAATPRSRAAVIALWQKKEAFLRLSNSNAGAVGLVLGELLLHSDRRNDHEFALELFLRLENEDWDYSRRESARRGRLRAMVKLGDAEAAVKEARQLAEESEDPAVLNEAKLVLAEAARSKLERLVEENPRWKEDDRVRPERNHLYHRALDLYLFPYLFHGTSEEQAARGLWGAVSIYRLSGEPAAAAAAARDIVVLYPETTPARVAEDFLKSMEPKNLKSDETNS